IARARYSGGGAPRLSSSERRVRSAAFGEPGGEAAPEAIGPAEEEPRSRSATSGCDATPGGPSPVPVPRATASDRLGTIEIGPSRTVPAGGAPEPGWIATSGPRPSGAPPADGGPAADAGGPIVPRGAAGLGAESWPGAARSAPLREITSPPTTAST